MRFFNEPHPGNNRVVILKLRRVYFSKPFSKQANKRFPQVVRYFQVLRKIQVEDVAIVFFYAFLFAQSQTYSKTTHKYIKRSFQHTVTFARPFIFHDEWLWYVLEDIYLLGGQIQIYFCILFNVSVATQALQ